MEIVQEEIKFIRLGDTGKAKHTGIITIATFKGTHTVKYGVAFCSPKDHYDKCGGNELAVRRLCDHYADVEIHPKKMHHNTIGFTILADIYMSNEYPDWAESIILVGMDEKLSNIVYEHYL